MNTRKLSDDEKRMSAALLAIRVASGFAFIYHGSGMLFGAFGGPGLAAFAEHMHYPMVVAALVGIAEFGGGIAMLTGILARLGAAGIIAVMLGAILMVHWKNGYDTTKGGFEYAFTQMMIALGVLIAGAGRYSLAYLFRPAGRTGAGETHAPKAAA